MNPLQDDIVEQVRGISGRKGGVDVVLEISGAPGLFDYLFDILRLDGHVIAIGHVSRPICLNLSKQISMKGVTLKGIFGRRIWETREHFSSLVATRLTAPVCQCPAENDRADPVRETRRLQATAGRLGPRGLSHGGVAYMDLAIPNLVPIATTQTSGSWNALSVLT